MGGFGDVGEARLNFNRMVRGMARLKEILENVLRDQETKVRQDDDGRLQGDAHGVGLDVRAGALALHQPVRRDRRWRVRRRPEVPEGMMDHKFVQYLKAVNGDKSLLQQWHHTTAFGHVSSGHEEIVQRMVK